MIYLAQILVYILVFISCRLSVKLLTTGVGFVVYFLIPLHEKHLLSVEFVLQRWIGSRVPYGVDILIISFYLFHSKSTPEQTRRNKNPKPNPTPKENTASCVNVNEHVIIEIFTMIHGQWGSKSSASRVRGKWVHFMENFNASRQTIETLFKHQGKCLAFSLC